MNPVIAFYAPCHRAGRTTAAVKALEIIQSAEICSFAEPIKRAVDAIFPNARKADMPVNVNLLQFTPREAMTAIEEAMKGLDREVWVKLMEAKINANCYNSVVTVIDDLRYPQEYDMLWGHGAYLIKIVRPELDSAEGLLECKYFHAKIINDCSLEEFEERVAEVVSKL